MDEPETELRPREDRLVDTGMTFKGNPVLIGVKQNGSDTEFRKESAALRRRFRHVMKLYMQTAGLPPTCPTLY